MSDKIAALVAEFVGTFMLVFTVGCTYLSSSMAWASTAIASTYMAMIYSFGNVSGGYLNPAVVLAAGLARKLPWPMVVGYIISQVSAGIAAGFCYSSLYQDHLSIGPRDTFSWWEAMIVEVLYTAMIAFVFLSVA